MTSSESKFKSLVELSKNILVITGAGISAESGIPTFRGVSSLRWRNYQSENLATLSAFKHNPSLVWEFYHFRREICLKAIPNLAHVALSKFQMKCEKENKKFCLITQNIDGLHRRAGSSSIVAIHGELYETRCMNCNDVNENFDSPICESLRNRGNPHLDADCTDIPVELLPRCGICKGLLRPNVVWFGENISHVNMAKSTDVVNSCDLCLVIGTSSVVYPVASFPMEVINRGVPVAEFNTERTTISSHVTFFFQGPSATTLPSLIG